VEHQAASDAAVTVALALAAGMLAQAIARHLRIPGIVLLLATGVLLGPDVADVVHPHGLGGALQALVGFAVAVILFEGGMNLQLGRLRREAGLIQKLLTLGALITAAGGTLAARWIMGWDWSVSVLFGTLVIVTGPTVINPLLRRIRVKPRVATVLEAEGVLIDAIGAVVAVVALQLVLSPGESFALGPLGVLSRLGFGLVYGAVGGALLGLLLRWRRIVPEGLENVFTLSLVLALYQTSNAFLAESGIMSVTAAGMIVGNMRTHIHRDLLEFKEQLTVMLIGMLFVLLAADVRLREVLELGWPGLCAVAVLMFVVRPLNVLVCTAGSELSWRERSFLAWLAPRGVVAAAVASLFAQVLTEFDIDGGPRLRALVFLVIAATVVIQGLSGGLVARMLGLRRRSNQGFAILGANELGHALGRVLRGVGQEDVVFIDSSPAACKTVEEDGFRVVYGNALEERTLQRAQLDAVASFVAVTTNEEINLLVAREAAEEFKVGSVHVAARRGQSNVHRDLVLQQGLSMLFGRPRDLELWALRLRRGIAEVEPWRLAGPAPGAEESGEQADPFDTPEGVLLPLVLVRSERAHVVSSKWPFRKGDVVHFAVFEEKRGEARDWLAGQGWVETTAPS